MEDERATSSERRSQCCVVRGVDKNQGGDTERRVDGQRGDKTVAGDVANGLIDIVQEITDRPEK